MAAYVFFRYGPRRGEVRPSSLAVALAVTFWILVEVVVDAAVAIPLRAELPRIHERYLIYLVLPLFITAFVAAARLPA